MDIRFDGVTVAVTDRATDANLARLQIDARKWRASKLRPKIYGDKVQAEISGADGGPIKTETKVMGEEIAFALRKAMESGE